MHHWRYIVGQINVLFVLWVTCCSATVAKAQDDLGIIVSMEDFLELPEQSFIEQQLLLRQNRHHLPDAFIEKHRSQEAARPTLRSCLPVIDDAAFVDLTSFDWSVFPTTGEMEVCVFRVASVLQSPDQIEGWLDVLGMRVQNRIESPIFRRGKTLEGDWPQGTIISAAYDLADDLSTNHVKQLCDNRPMTCYLAHSFRVSIVLHDGQVEEFQVNFNMK